MLRRATATALVIAVAVTTATLVAGGSVASAAVKHTHAKKVVAPVLFDAVFTGTGTYSMDQEATSISDAQQHMSANFSFTTKYSTTLFVASSKLPIGGVANAKTSKYAGKWTAATSGGGNDSCTTNGAFTAVKGGHAGYSGTRKKDGSWLIAFHGLPNDALAQSPLGANDCSTNESAPHDFWNDWIITSSHVGGDASTIVTAPVKVTLAELKKKSFVLPVTAPLGELPDERCDGAEGCGQKYRWSGSIKFTRVTKVHA